jgi:tetratricopeptide (TPR) repeat protein
MALGSVAARASSASPSASRWLFGPGPDLLLGCGLGYAALFVVLAAAGAEVRSAVPVALFPVLALLSGTPHYGATLLRVYERREDRRAYALFALHATVVLWALFVIGLYEAAVGSLLFTLYLTWSPWHYSGQNYGLAVLFLRRRGIPFSRAARRLLWGSFVLCYALTFLSLHAGQTTSYAPNAANAGAIQFLPLGLPAEWALWALLALGLLYVQVLGGLAVLLLRVASPRDLVPVAALVASQALWFAVPVVARAVHVLEWLEPLSVEYGNYHFFWIAVAHSVQYLWVTTYYAARDESRAGRAAYLGRAMLAGALIWGVPVLLFAPGVLGRMPYDAGLFALVASTVNLHHFVLDGAIWKLRDGRIARILLRRDEAAAAEPAPVVPGRGWVRGLIWATGALCAALVVLGSLESEFGFRRAAARGDEARVERAARRLAWMGRDGPEIHARLAEFAAARGDWEGALRRTARGAELGRDPAPLVALGARAERQGEAASAVAAYEAALDVDPDFVPALHRAGLALLARGDRVRARELLERASRLAPGDPAIEASLERARG